MKRRRNKTENFKAASTIDSVTPAGSTTSQAGSHSVSSQPDSYPVTPHKRKESDTSFGTRSTETTPKRMKKPETHIQNLQSTLVDDVLEAIEKRNFIKVEWPRNRVLHLTYEPYRLDAKTC